MSPLAVVSFLLAMFWSQFEDNQDRWHEGSTFFRLVVRSIFFLKRGTFDKLRPLPTGCDFSGYCLVLFDNLP